MAKICLVEIFKQWFHLQIYLWTKQLKIHQNIIRRFSNLSLYIDKNANFAKFDLQNRHFCLLITLKEISYLALEVFLGGDEAAGD